MNTTQPSVKPVPLPPQLAEIERAAWLREEVVQAKSRVDEHAENMGNPVYASPNSVSQCTQLLRDYYAIEEEIDALPKSVACVHFEGRSRPWVREAEFYTGILIFMGLVHLFASWFLSLYGIRNLFATSALCLLFSWLTQSFVCGAYNVPFWGRLPGRIARRLRRG
jgi:hypothetical protein